MKNRLSVAMILVPLISFSFGMPKAGAELPTLPKAPWINYFAAYSNRSFRIGVSTKGLIELTVMKDKDVPVIEKLVIPIEVTVQEALPDGRMNILKLDPESLSSEQDPTSELGRVAIRGSVTGKVTIEITLEQSRGSILIGSRIIDPGSAKQPLKVILNAAFSAPYPYVKQDQDEVTGEAFQKKIKNDRIELIWTDKKSVKVPLNKDVDASSPEVSGPGISSAVVDVISYAGKKIQFIASPNSAMVMLNPRVQPLRKGFSIQWSPDPKKDRDGKARLAIAVK
jgi:hypothetical protein